MRFFQELVSLTRLSRMCVPVLAGLSLMEYNTRLYYLASKNSGLISVMVILATEAN